MFEYPATIDLSDDGKEKEDLALSTNDEVNCLVEKSIERENDGGESDGDDPEMVINPIVNHLELVVDDSSNDSASKADNLTASAENGTATGKDSETTKTFSKPTEFVIVSTMSGSTVRFPDELPIKDELSEPIATTCPPNDFAENDPMGLLEIHDRSVSSSGKTSLDQDDGVADDISSTCSSSVQTTSSVVNISEWAKDYPWLLHEECDEWYGYCLYCDVKLSVRSYKSAKHHDLSLYHRERCENYLAFCEEEDKNNWGTSIDEIKEEYGTDSQIAALKLKRKTQAEAFNNYNWRRWLEKCPWLERDNVAGTIGLCKYCSVRLNVEFTYLRRRHQESAQHKERESKYKKSIEKSIENETIEEDDTVDVDKEDNEDNSTNCSAEKYSEKEEEKIEDHWCYESAADNGARCALCDIFLAKKSSFKRHLQTHLHAGNEKNHTLVAETKAKKGLKCTTPEEKEPAAFLNNWEILNKLHSWLIADPFESKYAYCKVCDKRLLYGSSAAKRAVHENSQSHKANEMMQGKDNNQITKQMNEENESAIDGGDEDEAEGEETDGSKKSENKSDEEEEEEEDDGSNNDEPEDDANEENEEGDNDDIEEEDELKGDEAEEEVETNADEDESKKSKSKAGGGDHQFPWSRKYKKDSKYCLCSYCKIVMARTSRWKHNSSKRHMQHAKNIKQRQQNQPPIKKLNNEANLFPWAAAVKGNPNLYYCKYCRVRISNTCSKKKHSLNDIHILNKNLIQKRKTSATPDAENRSSRPTSTAPVLVKQQQTGASSEQKVVVKGASFISLVKNWQKRYSWLGYKLGETRSNYAYCKACQQSMYVRSVKHIIKHARSHKHFIAVKQMRRDRLTATNITHKMELKSATKRETDQKASVSAADDTSMQVEESNAEMNKSDKDTKGNSYKSTLESMQKRYSWIMKATKVDYAYCRFCDVTVPLKILFLRNHTNSKGHRKSVVNFGKEKPKTEKNAHEESNTAENDADTGDDDDDDDDNDDATSVVLIEENAEELLISEQDENWTVKSEMMDEHEALDCLLQRAGRSAAVTNSGGSAQRDERKQKNTSSDDRPAAKRFKRAHSFRKMNERLDNSMNSSIMSSILSTPLTLASCLGPLIQQQIQQATNSHQAAVTTASSTATLASQMSPAMPKEPENSYDLFFKSISETMKKLPADIAAEGKLKVMQILCDLELKALKRQHEQEYSVTIRDDSTQQTYHPNLCSTPITPAASYQATENSILLSPTDDTLNYTVNNSIINRQGVNTNETINDNNPSTSRLGDSVRTPAANTSANSTQSQQKNLGLQSVQQKPQQITISTGANNNVGIKPQSSANNAPIETNKLQQQAPIIGVMDMNGLQTLQLRNNTVISQTPKQNAATNSNQIPKQNAATNSNPTAGSTTSLRCIPFKNLSQTTSSDPNNKYARIQMPITATTSTQKFTTSLVNTTPKGLLNLRNIHVTKKSGIAPGPPQQLQNTQRQQQTYTATPTSVSMVNTNKDKNQTAGIYVQSSNVQRWTPVNGSMNNVPNRNMQQYISSTANNGNAKTQNFIHK